MAYVNTVLGTIHPDEMGVTSLHEHIGFGQWGWQYDPVWWFDPVKRVEAIYHNLLNFKKAGGCTFVDCSGLGLGREIDLFTYVARNTGVNIVASAGFWADSGILGHFRNKDIDYHTELYVREVTQGIGNTGVKAGQIKVGINSFAPKPSPLEELTFRAAARAAKKTGACVHTHGITHALRQMEIFEEEKLDPDRVIIAHADAAYAIDLKRDREIMRKGYYLGYDHIGFEPIWSPARYAMPDERRVELVKAMVDQGFTDRIVIALDTSSWSLGWKTPTQPYHHLFTRFVPLLLKAGVKQSVVDKLLIENPRRVLPIQASAPAKKAKAPAAPTAQRRSRRGA